MYQQPHQHPHHRHGHHHPPGAGPTRLIVFFIAAPTVPQEIDDQLHGIYAEAEHIRHEFLKFFGVNVPDRLRTDSGKRLSTIFRMIQTIRGEVMKLAPTAIQPPAGAVNQLLLTDTVGILVAVLEADDSGVNFFPPAGKLDFAVDDPSSTITQGVGADGVSPTFLPNGSGNKGTVTVTVTDEGNNLVGKASFDLVDGVTPPPPGATQLGVFFVPNAGSAAPSGGASGSGSGDAAAAAAAAKAAGVATTVDPHK